jgi:hypothetical protein
MAGDGEDRSYDQETHVVLESLRSRTDVMDPEELVVHQTFDQVEQPPPLQTQTE